jgi:hypothetical protein
MMRLFLLIMAAALTAGTVPASALTCAHWCSTYHCRMTEAAQHRVCMNRCIASCRAIVKKRGLHGREQRDD